MSEEVRITELHMKAGEPIKVVAEGPSVMHLVNVVGQAFIESGAPNYVAINVTHDELGPMEVMVRRTSGKTVAQVACERGERLEKVRAAVFAYGENNLGTDVPFWFIAMNSPHGKVMLAGIFFSQEDASSHLERKRHRYPKSAHTWCAGAVDSHSGLRGLHALFKDPVMDGEGK
jgi:hypothetical protein